MDHHAEHDPQGIRSGEGLAEDASTPRQPPIDPDQVQGEGIRGGEGLAEDAGGEGPATRGTGSLGREGIRGDGLAEDA